MGIESSPYNGEDDPEYDGDAPISEGESFDEDEDDFVYDKEEDYLIDGVGFADPGGNSALRAATPKNPRNLPCGQCGTPDVLTPLDKQRGYVCDACAERAEGHGW